LRTTDSGSSAPEHASEGAGVPSATASCPLRRCACGACFVRPSNDAVDSALLIRWALLVVIVGSVTGLIVNVIALLKISLNPR
jgi:hypothetical protein